MPAAVVRVKRVRVVLLTAAAVWLVVLLTLVVVEWQGEGGHDWHRSIASHSRDSSVDDTNGADSNIASGSSSAPLKPQQLCILGSARMRSEVEEWMAEWDGITAVWSVHIALDSVEQQTGDTVEQLSSTVTVRYSRFSTADDGVRAAAQYFSSHHSAVQCQYFLLCDAAVRLELLGAEKGSSGWTASRDGLLSALRQHEPAVVTLSPPADECTTATAATTIATTAHPPFVLHRSLMEFVFPVTEWTGEWSYMGGAAAVSLLPSMYPLHTLEAETLFRTTRSGGECSEEADTPHANQPSPTPISAFQQASKALLSTALTNIAASRPAHQVNNFLALLDSGFDVLHPSIVNLPWVSARHTKDSLRAFRASAFQLRLTLLVFTLNRLTSLQRLLQSVLNSDYSGWEAVELHIHIDYSDVQSDVRSFVNSFEWPFGGLVRTYANATVGLRDSILSAWQPRTLDEFAVFLEDDIEVSPKFAVWVRVAVLHYYYSTDRPLRESPLMGVSLYMPVWSERVDQPFWVDSTFPVYGMQAPSSWGAVYFPHQWSDFCRWQRLHAHADPLVPALAGINRWSMQRSWKKYLIRYMVEQGLFMLYPNRLDGLSFSTNHAEAGTNVYFSSEWKAVLDARFNVPLVPVDDRDRWYQRHSAVLFGSMRVINIFDQAVKLNEQLRIPAIPAAAWRAYSHLTVTIPLTSASSASQAAVVASLHYWQELSVLHELVVQVPAQLNFTCPPLRVRCTVNRANVTSVDSYLWPLPPPRCAAVLLVSHHLRLPLVDVEVMFHVWQRHPDQVVGIANLTRSYRAQRGKYVKWTAPLPQLTLLPGGLMLLASHYLDTYWSEERPFHNVVRQSVWQRGRGEDVALLRLITNVTGRWPAVLDRAVNGSTVDLWHEPVQAYAADLDAVREGYGEEWPWLNGRTLHFTDTDTAWAGMYEVPNTASDA